ncbi:hypothetical protein COBT_001413 [Conglomerata obtusa]
MDESLFGKINCNRGRMKKTWVLGMVERTNIRKSSFVWQKKRNIITHSNIINKYKHNQSILHIAQWKGHDDVELYVRKHLTVIIQLISGIQLHICIPIVLKADGHQ